MAVDLRTARFLNNITQARLGHMTGIPQSRLSLAENGLTALKSEEKMKIATALGGRIDWAATENSKCDFAMPQEDYTSPKVGIKVRISKDPHNLPNPQPVHIGAPENSNKYRYLTWDEFIKGDY